MHGSISWLGRQRSLKLKEMFIIFLRNLHEGSNMEKVAVEVDVESATLAHSGLSNMS